MTHIPLGGPEEGVARNAACPLPAVQLPGHEIVDVS